MMKKNGFTLAEVLITLAIIGVVASLTLPSLMTNTAEQQAITAYKKIINTLTEAGQMNSAIDGFDYTSTDSVGTISDNFESDGKVTIGSILNSRLQVSPQAKQIDLGSGKNCAVLGDGTAICLGADSATSNTHYVLRVDTNGKKGPNKLAYCEGQNCNRKENRHIYDQFYVTLRGGVAYPGVYQVTGGNFQMEAGTSGNGNNAVLYVMGMESKN